MRKVLSWMSLTVAALAMVAGCGSSEDPVKVEEPKFRDSAAFCQAVAKAECSAAIREACSAGDESSCVAKVSSDCNSRNADVTFGLQTLEQNYRNTKAEACVNALAASYGDTKISADEHRAIRKACDPVFSAQKGEGGPCKVDLDCDLAAGLTCDIFTGTCRPVGTETKGGDCSSARCAPGLFCSSVDKICFDGRGEGVMCDPVSNPCKASLLCEGGTCVAKRAANADCTSDDQCASEFCALVPEGSNKARRICLTELSFGCPNGSCLSTCNNFKQ